MAKLYVCRRDRFVLLGGVFYNFNPCIQIDAFTDFRTLFAYHKMIVNVNHKILFREKRKRDLDITTFNSCELYSVGLKLNGKTCFLRGYRNS